MFLKSYSMFLWSLSSIISVGVRNVHRSLVAQKCYTFMQSENIWLQISLQTMWSSHIPISDTQSHLKKAFSLEVHTLCARMTTWPRGSWSLDAEIRAPKWLLWGQGAILQSRALHQQGTTLLLIGLGLWFPATPVLLFPSSRIATLPNLSLVLNVTRSSQTGAQERRKKRRCRRACGI